MLRIVCQSNAAAAKGYYSGADYYLDGQELSGRWGGRGAAMLGLASDVQKAEFDRLCDNLHPDGSGKPLTARTRESRRVLYDVNFHVPKSVSLLHALTDDPKILGAFRDAVAQTMTAVESEMKTRVRTRGREEDRDTGNMLWAEFVHLTGRPVDGVPDPHLHAHCCVFNATYDSIEDRWKAGQFGDLKRDARYFEALFHCTLADRLIDLGLAVERTQEGWELAGMPDVLKRYSRRTEQIERLAAARGVTDPDQKAELGATSRSRKQKNLTMTELRAEWRGRLSVPEQAALDTVHRQVGGVPPREPGGADNAVAFALGHCFEREAVVPETSVLETALRHATGRAAPAGVKRAYDACSVIRRQSENRTMVTTPEVLAAEGRLIGFAREGRGSVKAFMPDCEPFLTGSRLNVGQRRAVRHVLTSTDRVVLIRGAAGTGKTTLMRDSVAAIESTGRRVAVLAPSSQASRGVLRDDGFATADTVARFASDTTMQERARNGVIWIDEVGLLGSRDAARLFATAERLGARVILSGDRKQHRSVTHGSVLDVLEEHAGLPVAGVTEVLRQKGTYKRAVELLSQGRAQEGFDALDRLGWVKQLPDAERATALAAEYVAAVRAGKSTLVVSPTHAEAAELTAEIRTALKRAGLVAPVEHETAVLVPQNLTEAERANPETYQPGDILQFIQNAPGHKIGTRVTVTDPETVPTLWASRFQVYRPTTVSLSIGDTVRLTANGKTRDGRHRLNNGATYKVSAITAEGDLVLGNGWVVGRDFAHLAHGYVVTSHASQGRTVDTVLIGQSAISRRATSAEQFYVSVSRGRSVTVFTDDKDALRDAVSRSDPRRTATALVTAGQAARQRPTLRDRVQRFVAQAQRLAQAVTERFAGREPDLVLAANRR